MQPQHYDKRTVLFLCDFYLGFFCSRFDDLFVAGMLDLHYGKTHCYSCSFPKQRLIILQCQIMIHSSSFTIFPCVLNPFMDTSGKQVHAAASPALPFCNIQKDVFAMPPALSYLWVPIRQHLELIRYRAYQHKTADNYHSRFVCDPSSFPHCKLMPILLCTNLLNRTKDIYF